MNKIQRKHLKLQKRTLRLLYRKGLIDKHEPEDLYWCDYDYHYSKRKYGNRVPLMNVYFDTVDYWGEVDETDLIGNVIDLLWWDGAYDFCQESGYPEKSTFEPRTKLEFIKYLEKLPTVRNDSKINVALKVKNN